MATATATKLRNFIDGKTMDPAEGRTEEVLNPATAEPFAEGAGLHPPRTSIGRWRAARRAFEEWARTTPKERSEAIYRLATVSRSTPRSWPTSKRRDAGKPRASVIEEEMPGNVDNLRFFAGAARCLDGQASGEFVEGRTSIIRREPAGWSARSHPGTIRSSMAVWKLGPALATGNTVVLKPRRGHPGDDASPRRARGGLFPPGVLNVIGGHGDPAGAAPVRHPGGGHGLPDRVAADRASGSPARPPRR